MSRLVFIMVGVVFVVTHAVGPTQKGVATSDLNRTVDPCTNFYEFANGAWRADNPIPKSLPKWSRRIAAHDANQGQLQAILDEVSQNRRWPAGSVEQRVGDYYASCMDEVAIDAAGVTPVAPLLAEIDGIRNVADVQHMIRRLHDLAITVVFATSGGLDNHEPGNSIANLAAGGLGLPDRDYYLKPDARFAEARQRYRTHVAKILALGAMGAAQTTQATEAVLALEKRLAEASLDSTAAADPAATDHKMSFVALKQLAPRFDWDRYFTDAKLPRVDLNVAEPKLIQQFDRELAETSLADWKSYLKWQLLDAASPWLSKPFADESYNFKEQYLAGATAMKSRTRRCVESTDAQLGDALAQKYVEKYFPPAAKAKAKEIASALLAAPKEDVAGVPWMTPETKKKALQKLATLNPQMGYPDRWKDYSSVAIHRATFWANLAAGRRYNVDDNRKQIGKPTNRSQWQLAASSPDAYLDLQLNELVLPAGFLQPPAFNLDATDAVNYGAIGIGLAHDMTHGIDAGGAEIDLVGRARNWWTDADLKEFQKRAQCVSEQYDGYFIEPGLHHQGKLVMSEAIGDLAGVRIAYSALKKSMQSHPVPVVDGFTPEQQFFISWGQFRGDAISPAAQRQMIKSDPHPVSKFRVNGPLSSSPEFQQAFSCKAGAEMVRPAEKRCAVW